MIAGIDYSLTSPSLCVFDEEKEFKFENCKFYIFHKKKICLDNIVSYCYPIYKSEMERYLKISSLIIENVITPYKRARQILIEDYAFSATGRVFHIAENTGILKQQLHSNFLHYDVIAPTVIKKFATGKGNASKEIMHESFVKETGIDLKNIVQPKSKLNSPTTDIIDSYYICKFLNERLNNGKST